MEINFEDYLSEDERKEIVTEEYRKLVRKNMAKENDLKRILSNISFDVFYSIVDECFDGTSKEIIKGKIDEILNDPSSYNVFKKPDAWDRESNSAYLYMQEIITNHKPRIANKISELLDKQVVETCKADIKDIVETALAEHIKAF